MLALLLVAALVGWFRASNRIRRGNRTRQRRASRGEVEAEELLAARGYRVVDRQVSCTWTLQVDGAPVEVRSRADLLVERKGRQWIAEVKTGENAPNPSRPATRRQLLEYLLVFDVAGVLLVDAEAGEVRRVTFPELIE